MVPYKVTVSRKVSPEAQQPRIEDSDQICWEPRVSHHDHNAEDLKEEAAAESPSGGGKTLDLRLVVESPSPDSPL